MNTSILIENLPNFSNVVPNEIVSNLKKIIEQNNDLLDKLLKKSPPYTWENWISPLEEIDDRTAKFWSLISHLYTVVGNKDLSAAYQIGFPMLTEHLMELAQNQKLYDALSNFKKSAQFNALTQSQRRSIEIRLRNFKLNGVALPLEEKNHFINLQKKLSSLMSQYSENVFNATQAWYLHITQLRDLEGLSESFIQLLKKNAERIDLTGWVITLEHSCYSVAMKYLANRNLRKQLYEAYVTRASDQGPHAGRWDNTGLIEDILKARHKIANILGFSNYAELSLSTKMMERPEHVLQFIYDLIDKTKKIIDQEMQSLMQFSIDIDQINKLEAWDIVYYAERFVKNNFKYDEQTLMPFFPIHKVLSGLFSIANKIFGIHIIERTHVDKWHPTVQCFEIIDQDSHPLGIFYTDLYARPNKREGAWLDPQYSLRRRVPDSGIQCPIAFLISDISRPVDEQPAMLSHYDIIGLFHEFGHCLHHLLTNVESRDVSGMKGVPWDFVEFPSQFMEHWCWEPETLSLISEHIKTKECLPDTAYRSLLATKKLFSSIEILKKLQYALFDFRLHLEHDLFKDKNPQALFCEIFNKTTMIDMPSFCRFQNSFLHIFDERYPYAAGFYSYLWAAVLASDAYSKFKETDIFNSATGQDFLRTILIKGGSDDPIDLFIAFCNRPPTLNAFLKYNLLVNDYKTIGS